MREAPPRDSEPAGDDRTAELERRERELRNRERSMLFRLQDLERRERRTQNAGDDRPHDQTSG